LKDKVTWLNKYSDSKIDPIELAAELCYQVEEIYKRVILKQEQAILDEWKALSVTLGQDVICTSGKTKIEGRAQDLSESGALIVRTKSGIKEIHAGEISICNKDGSYC
ncbi:MAG: hypothetical protein K8F91_17825, partial [Candidatus Obscuribacterales bacterium]|nr:hypothetical protein [Candidatus Obscuribacterales bacterium]